MASDGNRFSGFYRLSLTQRRALLETACGDVGARWYGAHALTDEDADRITENALGVFGMPLGLLPQLIVDGTSRRLPMVTEEASVVAGANKASTVFNRSGGVKTRVDDPHTLGHIYWTLADGENAPLESWARALASHEASLLALANAADPTLQALGGGAVSLHLSQVPKGEPAEFVIVELRVRTLDAMGANAVNTMLETLVEPLSRIFAREALLAILSNDGSERMVEASVRLERAHFPALAPEDASELLTRIARASRAAECFAPRAVTHNKGIMNGIVALGLALGQDTRAMESAAHHFAARSGATAPLSRWILHDGALLGTLRMPLVVGYVGGVRSKHPGVQASFDCLGAENYAAFAGAFAALGLAQNFAALWALTTDGIQKGHMRLHLRSEMQAKAPSKK